MLEPTSAELDAQLIVVSAVVRVFDKSENVFLFLGNIPILREIAMSELLSACVQLKG